MPLYEYECKKCHHRFERIQKFSDRMVKKCPECGGPVEQMISAPAVQFKGSGWYVTDYAKKSGAPASSSTGESHSTGSASEQKGESNPKESTPKGSGSKNSESTESTGDSGSKKEDKTKSESAKKSGKK